MFSEFSPSGEGYEPLYRQIASFLKQKITAGKIADGQQLPPEPELAAALSTSRPTLRKALKELEAQELLVQRKGRGTFVAFAKQDQLYRVAIHGVGRTSDLFAQEVLSGLHEAFANFRHEFLFLDYQNENILEQYRSIMADALFLVAVTESTQAELQKKCYDAIPMVLMNAHPVEIGKRDVIETDSEPIRPAVAHLATLGHRRIGYITMPLKNSNLNDRDNSYRQAIHEFGLDEDPELFRCGEGMYFDSGCREARALLALPDPATAIICPGRAISYGAWQGILETGLRIPDDVSFIGYDLPDWVNPHLSTLSQNQQSMARAAGKMLLARLRNGITHEKTKFAIELIDRGSTAPVKPYKEV